MRTMYDSIWARDIPHDAPMVAGYVDGIYAWTPTEWAYFPSVPKVRITVSGGTLDAHVADVETGDLTVAQGAAWLARRVARYGFGVLYFSRGLLGAVFPAVQAYGLKSNQWGVWVADWTGVPHGLVGATATQYDHPWHSGGHYDLSEVSDYWPTVDPVPDPPPPPPPDVPDPQEGFHDVPGKDPGEPF